LHYSVQREAGGNAEPSRLRQAIVAEKEEEIRLADAIIVASSTAHDSYRAAGIPEARLHVVPLGVDLDHFQPAKAAAGQPFTFVFAGNVTRAKGIDLLLDAFSKLSDASGPIRLRVFGTGEMERADRRSSIEWLGRVPANVMSAELPLGDCLVLPSRLDSFGLIVAESLASGVPVILSDAVGARDLIDEGRSGWLFPSGDADALRQRMQQVVDDRRSREQWRAAARESAMRAGWESYHLRFASVIERILQQRSVA
jgi:glycosyltransferase involved in cell wall biosynthesis